LGRADWPGGWILRWNEMYDTEAGFYPVAVFSPDSNWAAVPYFEWVPAFPALAFDAGGTVLPIPDEASPYTLVDCTPPSGSGLACVTIQAENASTSTGGSATMWVLWSDSGKTVFSLPRADGSGFFRGWDEPPA